MLSPIDNYAAPEPLHIHILRDRPTLMLEVDAAGPAFNNWSRMALCLYGQWGHAELENLRLAARLAAPPRLPGAASDSLTG